MNFLLLFFFLLFSNLKAYVSEEILNWPLHPFLLIKQTEASKPQENDSKLEWHSHSLSLSAEL